jgi:asparagine synthase (glutamine-hydrolysing)
MRGRIPESVRARVDKMGCPVPARRWFETALGDAALDIITARPARERGIYNVRAIVEDLERHRRGEIDVTQKLFDVAQYETWCSL